MKKIIAETYEELSRETSQRIAMFIRENPDSLVCFAAGDTPLGTYSELVKMQAAGEVNLSDVYYAGLDEWIGLGENDKGSCYQVMHDHFYNPARIPKERIHVFDGLKDPQISCEQMNEWLAKRGKLGLTLLGIGMNGHLGFNEPNVPQASGAIIVPLDETTKTVSVKYFDKELPVSMGVTLGLSTLLAAREVLLIASGEKKAQLIRNTFNGTKNPANPASMLQGHPRLTLLLDREASGL